MTAVFKFETDLGFVQQNISGNEKALARPMRAAREAISDMKKGRYNKELLDEAERETVCGTQNKRVKGQMWQPNDEQRHKPVLGTKDK